MFIAPLDFPMDRLIINGGRRLSGDINISGAKNSALPIIAASLLTQDKLQIGNLPHLQDVTTMISVMQSLGVQATILPKMAVILDSHKVGSYTAPYDQVRTMRASILVLGPLLARFGRASVSLPGGCAIGTRPVDQHIRALRAMGAEIEIDGGYINASSNGRLRGADIVFDMVTVTGTENLIMAAVLADGQTTLRNCAREPEVVDLVNCLVKMGANIQGQGSDVIVIEGVEELHGCEHQVIPDRIEAGTYLIAATATRGQVRLRQACAAHLDAVLQKLSECGAEIKVSGDTIDLQMTDQPRAVNIKTAPYPGFPTDLQAQMVALNSVAVGSSSVTENIFENRFMHIQEMLRMGAKISTERNVAVINGQQQLHSAPVMATDLRASASLVIAGLVAEGQTTIDRIYHIDRGYECIEEKLYKLNASIKRTAV